MRNRIKTGELKASQDPKGRWKISRASLDEHIAAGGARPVDEHADEIGQRLDDLTQAVERLGEPDGEVERALQLVERERDRYRAEAATAREVALQAVASARETYSAVERLLPALRAQSDALAQLLAPGSLHDVLP